MNTKKSSSRMPNAIVLLMALIVLVGILSYFIPSGKFEKILVDGKEVVDPASFHIVDKTYLSPLDIFNTVHQGLFAAAPLLFMILIIGGSVKLFERTGAIEGVIASFARKFGSDKSSWVIVLVFSFFAFLGAFPGMLEAAIPFAPLCIAIALGLGYDVLVGIMMPVVAISIGWTAGPTNPWTVGIGQNMAGLPMFSGLGYRLLVLFVLWAVSLLFILHYAAKVKRNPALSAVNGIDGIISKTSDIKDAPFTSVHKIVLAIFAITLGMIIFGAIAWKWGFPQMSSLYIIGGIAAGLACKYSLNDIADTFINGGRDIFAGVIAVGLARGLSVIMEKAGIIDTIIYYLSLPLKELSTMLSASVMFFVQSAINFFIPSGSGQAMATLPIMLPLSDIIGLSKQVTILAFQFGDGLSNLCYPTVAVLIAYLTYTGVPFSRWFRFILPLLLLLWIVAVSFTAAAVAIGWN